MSKKIFPPAMFFLFAWLLSVLVNGQPLACKRAAFSALRQIPVLKYRCSPSLKEWDEKVLIQPNRVRALRGYARALEKLTFADWWNAAVDDLNVCYFRGKPGVLSPGQKEDYENGNYFFSLLGNKEIRLIVARDPCYQTGFGGSNMFLLSRAGSRVYAAQAIDGFYTRSDYPPVLDFARSGREQVIEIATTSGGLNPTVTNYYFTINPGSRRAIPKNLFREDGKPTNKITSMMLLEEAESYGLPPKSEPLQIFKNSRLAPHFDVFQDTGEIFGADNHPKFAKRTLRWNGKFYE